MKKLLLLTGLLCFGELSFSQGLLDMNENKNAQKKYAEEVYSFGDNKGNEGDAAQDEAEKKPFPILNFGSDLALGSDAIGFRPTILVSTSLAKKYFYIQPSVRVTQVDDQSFSLERTGQSLFIRDISNFSVNLDAILGIPNKKKSDSSRVGFLGSFSFRGNSLFNLDSTTFKSVKNDINLVNVMLGTEVIAVWEHLSFYHTWNMMSVTNNRSVYHSYFNPGAQKDFIYPQLGMKFKVLEGKEEFKNVIIDFSAIWIGKRMQTIAGNDNTIIPLLKVGYVQRINLKKPNEAEKNKKLREFAAEKKALQESAAPTNP